MSDSAEAPNRLLNNPFAAVDEMLDGILAAFPHGVRRTPRGRGLITLARAERRRVCVVTGGGSGHEPAFLGYLGPGLADAVAVGNVFASPSATPVVEVVQAVGDGEALFIFGNYDGDVMNFGMAADLLLESGIRSDTVLVTDDLASARRGSEADRRGVAGDVIVVKAAGARADEGASLADVAAAARHANQRTRTVGVGLDACTLPTSRRPVFELPHGQVDVGMGIHGEAGLQRSSLRPADEVTDELISMLLDDLPLATGEPVALLVNLLGATPYLEGFIVLRRAVVALQAAGVPTAVAWIGEYVTSLDMRGLSLTLTALDEELNRLLNAPARPLFAPELRPWQ